MRGFEALQFINEISKVTATNRQGSPGLESSLTRVMDIPKHLLKSLLHGLYKKDKKKNSGDELLRTKRRTRVKSQ